MLIIIMLIMMMMMMLMMKLLIVMITHVNYYIRQLLGPLLDCCVGIQAKASKIKKKK